MSSDTEKPRIMIVDDQTENIHMLMAVLKDEYAVTPSLNGKAAIEKQKGTRPDLILLDILMPDIDGYDVCKGLKNDVQTKDIPIIFLTAVSEAMDAAKAFEIGAVDYITKPFNPVTVKARIKTHITLSATLKELKDALDKVKNLEGLIPICSSCKQIRDDKGFWHRVEKYIEEHSGVSFSHGLCPDCIDKMYGDKEWYQEKKQEKADNSE